MSVNLLKICLAVSTTRRDNPCFMSLYIWLYKTSSSRTKSYLCDNDLLMNSWHKTTSDYVNSKVSYFHLMRNIFNLSESMNMIFPFNFPPLFSKWWKPTKSMIWTSERNKEPCLILFTTRYNTTKTWGAKSILLPFLWQRQWFPYPWHGSKWPMTPYHQPKTKQLKN